MQQSINNIIVLLLFICTIFLFYLIYNIILAKSKNEGVGKKSDELSSKDDSSLLNMANKIPKMNIEEPFIINKNVVQKGNTRFEYVDLGNGKIIIFHMTENYEPNPEDVRFTNEIEEADKLFQKEEPSLVNDANEFQYNPKTEEELEYEAENIEVTDATFLVPDAEDKKEDELEEQIRIFAKYADEGGQQDAFDDSQYEQSEEDTDEAPKSSSDENDTYI